MRRRPTGNEMMESGSRTAESCRVPFSDVLRPAGDDKPFRGTEYKRRGVRLHGREDAEGEEAEKPAEFSRMTR